jgi:rRNA maturation endonuclease Nob1
MGIFSKKLSGSGSNTTEDLIQSFIVKSEGLQRILEKETEYFRDLKIKQAEVLIENKLSLIDEIENIKINLLLDQLALKSLPESEKLKIKEANDRLMKAAEENYNETLKAKEVNKLILEAISSAVMQSRVVEGAYGDKGSAYSNNNESMPIAVVHNA